MKIIKIIFLILLFGSAFCQAQIPAGAILHLKSDAGLVLNGNKVTEWNDLNNPGIKAFQSDENLQPSYVSDGLNGKPTVRFDGTGFLEASSIFPVMSDYSLIFVVSVANFSPLNLMISGNGHGVYYNPPRIFHTNTNVQTMSSKVLSLNVPAVICATYSESTQVAKIYMDGVLTGSAQVGSNYDPLIYIGAFYKAYFYNGDMPEIILYNKVLAQTEQKNVESYLFDKYLIERPTDGLKDNTFTSVPANGQLFPRDKDNSADVKIAGNFKQEKFQKIIVRVFKNNQQIETLTQSLSFNNGTAPFSFNYKIHAELSNYKFLISAANPTQDSVMKVRNNIVAGDVIFISGQSNSVANNNPYTNGFIRTFGYCGLGSSLADTLWYMADDWYSSYGSNIGAWGMTMAKHFIENQKVPICVINGGVGGTIVEQHLPVTGNRYDLNSIYGGMLYRIEKAKLRNASKTLFWYQGESNQVFNYRTNFVKLTDEWLKDFPSLEKIYTVQFHTTSCVSGYTHSHLREVQRTMPNYINKVKVGVIAASGLPGHDGCHYEFTGYEPLGDQLYRQFIADYYGSKDTFCINSPNISEAFFTNMKKDRVALVFTPKQTIINLQSDTVVAGVAASLKDYIYLSDGAKIMSLESKNDTVFVNLDRGSKATTITYLPDSFYNGTYVCYEGPWIWNQRRMAALSFDAFPIAVKKMMVIADYTKELISCTGSEGNFLICAADASEGTYPQYQWYKDGIEIAGETNPQLNFATFDYPVSGIYTCKVTAQGFDKVLWSGDIPVYALSLPEITDHPKEVINAQIGGTYSFEVKAHYRGKTPPYMKDSFQWYKLESGNSEPTALVDNGKFGGTTSSILTINGLSAEDICKKGEYYIVEIISQCGSVHSNPFIISQKPEVVFSEHPKDTEVCPGSDVVLEAKAIAPQGYNVTYSWKKDNAPITDNSKYNGTNTSKLQVFNTKYDDDAGYYQCTAAIPSEGIYVEGVPALLLIKAIPTAEPINGISEYTIKRGNDASFKVDFKWGAEPIAIKWTFNNEVIQEGVWDKFIGDKLLTLSLESVNENQAGEYTCSLENECAKTEVKFNLIVTKWDEAGISDNENSRIIVTPNPAGDHIEISLDRWSPSARWTPSKWDEIQIYNTLGECLINYELRITKYEKTRIDITYLPVGFYFIKIGNYTEKFVVMR
ncbi:MAG: immunoglobulin domain-containing protein [bacterium]